MTGSDTPQPGADTQDAGSGVDTATRSLLRAVAHATTDRDDEHSATTREVALLLAADGGPVGLGSEPWWGLETRSRDLEQRGLLTVITIRDERKSESLAMRTTDDYGLALTPAGRQALGDEPGAGDPTPTSRPADDPPTDQG